MFLVFIAMCATEFASHALAVRALDFFAQCRNFYKVIIVPYPDFLNQYVHVYVCMHVRTHARTHARTHICVH